MKTLSLPANSWASKLTFGPYSQGVWQGVLGFTMHLTGAGLDKDPAKFLRSVLETIMSVPYSKTRGIIRFRGKFQQNDLVLSTLVKALKSYNFMLQFVIDQPLLGDWVTNMDWFIFETRYPDLPYNVHEVWYMPEDGAELGGFTMPPTAKASAFFLDPGRRTFDEVSAFIAGREERWALMQ